MYHFEGRCILSAILIATEYPVLDFHDSSVSSFVIIQLRHIKNPSFNTSFEYSRFLVGGPFTSIYWLSDTQQFHQENPWYYSAYVKQRLLLIHALHLETPFRPCYLRSECPHFLRRQLPVLSLPLFHLRTPVPQIWLRPVRFAAATGILNFLKTRVAGFVEFFLLEILRKAEGFSL